MTHVLILGNGVIEDEERHRSYLQNGRKPSLVICADGGVRNALKLGIPVHTVIGDLDSLEKGLYHEIEKTSQFQIYPRHKDKSDLEMALDYALLSRPSSVMIMGALGNRMDHSLINISLLEKCLSRDVPATMVSDREELVLMDRFFAVKGEPGQVVSLLPVSNEVTGIYLAGFVYPLTGGSLRRGESRGLSNELTGREGLIDIESGLLLVAINKKDL